MSQPNPQIHPNVGATAQAKAAEENSAGNIVTGEGYISCLIGRIVAMHAAYYSRWVGFGAAFECRVAGDLAEFVIRLERPCNGIWHALQGDQIVGSIAIDGEDLGNRHAHLRWFIVADHLRGAGLGKALLQQALLFSDRHGFAETHLWTLKGLDTARKLYERHGFVLADEYRGDQWGTEIVEQKFVRTARR